MRGSPTFWTEFFLRRLLWISPFCIVALLPAAALADDSVRLRTVPWGATAEQVKSGEPAPLKHETNSGAITYLVYSDVMLGQPVSVVYRLIHNALFEIVYSFDASKKSCAELSKTFDAIVAQLSATRGAPVQNSTVDSGCNRVREWTPGETLLSVNLSNDSGRSDLAISSRSAELSLRRTHYSAPITVR